MEECVLGPVSEETLAADAERRARYARALLGDQLTVGTNQTIYMGPLSLGDLKGIGCRRGIVGFEFGAPLASEGKLVPLAGGGFNVFILRSDATSRARFSLAHEIGHTFLYDVKQLPPSRLRIKATEKDPLSERLRALEERFCDLFAAELLFPLEAAASTFANLRGVQESVTLLSALEATSKEWGISVKVALDRLNQIREIPADTEIVVWRQRTHAVTRSNPALRVVHSFPRPARRWFVPANQRVESIGLKGASALYECWEAFTGKERGRKYRRAGVWSFEYRGGNPCVLENEAAPKECIEILTLWRKLAPDKPWRRTTVEGRVAYRFYAMNASEAYGIAAIDLAGQFREVDGATRMAVRMADHGSDDVQ